MFESKTNTVMAKKSEAEVFDSEKMAYLGGRSTEPDRASKRNESRVPTVDPQVHTCSHI